MEAQKYLENNSIGDARTIDLRSLSEKLTGEFYIKKNYSSLEEVNLSGNELNSLIIDCPQLKTINIRNNLLSKLQIIDGKSLEEIVAGGNQITSLNLTSCSNLKKLVIPDNPLTEIIGINLANIKEFNITNTSVSLEKNDEDLKKENQSLYNALSKVSEAVLEKKLIIAETIQNSFQAEKEINNLLNEVGEKWKKHFYEEEKDPFLEVNVDDLKKKEKAQKILIEIFGAISSSRYEKLVKEWNGEEKENYNSENDFDGSLERLLQLLTIKANLVQKEKTLTEKDLSIIPDIFPRHEQSN